MNSSNGGIWSDAIDGSDANDGNGTNGARDALAVEVLVTVLDSHVGDLSGVASQLAAAGMTVLLLQPALGAVTGRAPAALLGGLRRVEGVDAVEIARRLEIV